MNESVVSQEKQDLFLKSLRQQTGESHNRLEQNKFSKVLLQPYVTLHDYQVYIAKLYGMTKACENDIFPLLTAVNPDLGERYKAQFILEDLKKTGLSQEQIGDLPVSGFRPAGVAEALGAMYVLEGSTLGGKILYKHVNEFLGIDQQTGASYFYGYGQQTGVLWKRFIADLADYAVEEDCGLEIISGAVSTFTAIDHWLNSAEINW